jgi:hypothetical protein
MRVGFVALLGMGLAIGCSNAADDGTASIESAASSAEKSHLATSLAVSEVAVFQNLKVTVAKDGASVAPTLPILGGRDALVRVYVSPTGTRLPAGPVTAILEIADEAGRALEPLTVTKTLTAASTEAALDSTFNFNVPGASLPVGATFSVALTEAGAPSVADGVASVARFPTAGGNAPVGVARPAEQLNLVLVPIAYKNSDGATFLPDTSPEQVERYKQQFLALYPLSNIEITVHEPFAWNTGFSIGKALQAMIRLRADESPAPNTYYYGSFATRATFAEYCSGGCVTGLSGVPGPDSVGSRASVGVGFTGWSSARTFVHEVGHAHGRRHAPCGGAAGPDASFPHAEGSIGVWGFNPLNQTIVDPTATKDVMSYCRPHFISDYNYNKLLDRLTHVNASAEAVANARGGKVAYRFAEVGADGALEIGDRVELADAPGGEPRRVVFEDGSGNAVAEDTAQLVEYDHLPGGFLFIPEQKLPFTRVSVDGVGRTR